jgi:MFS family permease
MDFGFVRASIGRSLIMLGAEMAQVAVCFEVYDASRDPLSLGLLGLAQFLPVFLFAIPAGHVADRWPRQRISVLTTVGVALTLLSLVWLERSHLPSMLVVMCVLGTLRAFSGPATNALISALIPDRDVARASAVNSVLFMGAIVVGPAVGGALFAAAGSAVYVVAATVAALAALAFAILRVPKTDALSTSNLTLNNALDGLRFMRSQPALLASVGLDFVAVFLGGVTALLPVYAVEVLHVGAVGLGVLRAAPAIGAGVMGLWLAVRTLEHRPGRALIVSVIVFGACTVVFGVSRSFPLSLAMLAMLGAADMVSVVVRGSLLRTLVPGPWRGRVSAMNSVFIGGSNQLGELESGVAAKLLGAPGAVVVGGVGAVAVAGLAVWLVPGLWGALRLEDAAAPIPPDLAG